MEEGRGHTKKRRVNLLLEKRSKVIGHRSLANDLEFRKEDRQIGKDGRYLTCKCCGFESFRNTDNMSNFVGKENKS